MLTNAPVHATIPVLDLKRALTFYTDRLGLKVVDPQIEGGATLEAGGGSKMELYQRRSINADHTLASFRVDDIETAVNELKANGVEFEEYDEPGFKTVNSIAKTSDHSRCAWFKDSEGNFIGLTKVD